MKSALMNICEGQVLTHSLRKADHENSERIRDTGGTTVFFSPGLSSQLNGRLSSSATIMLPILQNLSGDHQEVDYNILLSIGYSF